MTFPWPWRSASKDGDEVMELELNEAPAADELLARLRPQAPPGLRVRVGGGPAAGQPQGPRGPGRSASYQVAVPGPRLPGLEERIQRLLAASTSLVRRREPFRADRPSRLAPGAGPAAKTCLQMRLRTDPGGSAGPRDVLAALGLEDLEHEGHVLTRTAVEIDSMTSRALRSPADGLPLECLLVGLAEQKARP